MKPKVVFAYDGEETLEFDDYISLEFDKRLNAPGPFKATFKDRMEYMDIIDGSMMTVYLDENRRVPIYEGVAEKKAPTADGKLTISGIDWMGVIGSTTISYLCANWHEDMWDGGLVKGWPGKLFSNYHLKKEAGALIKQLFYTYFNNNMEYNLANVDGSDQWTPTTDFNFDNMDVSDAIAHWDFSSEKMHSALQKIAETSWSGSLPSNLVAMPSSAATNLKFGWGVWIEPGRKVYFKPAGWRTYNKSIAALKKVIPKFDNSRIRNHVTVRGRRRPLFPLVAGAFNWLPASAGDYLTESWPADYWSADPELSVQGEIAGTVGKYSAGIDVVSADAGNYKVWHDASTWDGWGAGITHYDFRGLERIDFYYQVHDANNYLAYGDPVGLLISSSSSLSANYWRLPIDVSDLDEWVYISALFDPTVESGWTKSGSPDLSNIVTVGFDINTDTTISEMGELTLYWDGYHFIFNRVEAVMSDPISIGRHGLIPETYESMSLVNNQLGIAEACAILEAQRSPTISVPFTMQGYDPDLMLNMRIDKYYNGMLLSLPVTSIKAKFTDKGAATSVVLGQKRSSIGTILSSMQLDAKESVQHGEGFLDDSDLGLNMCFTGCEVGCLYACLFNEDHGMYSAGTPSWRGRSICQSAYQLLTGWGECGSQTELNSCINNCQKHSQQIQRCKTACQTSLVGRMTYTD